MAETSVQNLMDTLAAEIAHVVLARVRAEMEEHLKASTVLCWSEEEAAALLGCSPQTLASKRKAGEIDSMINPAGRPVYVRRHLDDYLLRHEKRS